MRVKVISTNKVIEVKQVGDKLFDKENNCYSLSQVILLNGWHPASELPAEEGEYIAINDGIPGVFHVNYLKPFGWCVEVMGEHEVVNIKQWCYPPEKKE